MTSYIFLQHYWWFLVSLLGALLTALLFVQGGQGLLYIIGRDESQRNLIVNSLGRKWELTFTTLVTFGGAFFASFPLFYSTSFGGAFYVWTAILLLFVLQAVAYEFRRKPRNLLGAKTFECFLMLNGVGGTLLFGTAVGTLFTGGNFTVDYLNLENAGGNPVISQWASPWYGLEAVADYRNVALGLAVVFLARSLALLFFMYDIDDDTIAEHSRRRLRTEAPLAVLFLVVFLAGILPATGMRIDPATSVISPEKGAYWHNITAMPYVSLPMLAGVTAIVAGIALGIRGRRGGFWWSAAGTVATVLCLLLLAGWNNTCYYPSLADMQSSLALSNSSSSPFTLKVMAWVSLFIPFVAAYITYVWRSLGTTRQH